MRIHGALARLMTMVTVLALALAPAIVKATHGLAGAAQAAEVAAHGHSHDGGGTPWQGHDATDHEHQQNAVLSDRTQMHDGPAGRLRVLTAFAADGWPDDRPRRPPRARECRRA